MTRPCHHPGICQSRACADCPHAPRLPFREAGDPPPTGGERAVLIVICIAWAACAAITLGVMLRACGGELQRLPQPMPVKMDHGWRQQDMDTSDEFGAALAAAAPASAAKEQA